MHRLRQSIKAAPLVRAPSELRSSRRLARREKTEVAALRAHVEELEAARASGLILPEQTIRKAVTVFVLAYLSNKWAVAALPACYMINSLKRC